MFYINLDITPLLATAQGLDEAAKKAMKDQGERLTAMTRAHIVEEAGKKLHTRRQMFIDGLSHFQLDENTWVVNLDAKVRWIDDGMPAHNMIEDLLNSPKAKTAKDGSKYVVVPFQHKKGPTQMTPAQKTLLDTIKSTLKNNKDSLGNPDPIPYGKIETDGSGKAKLGLLHSLDIKHAPIKTTNSPGQGKGPIGKVMQGATGIPLLQGIRIYQKEVKNKNGSTSVKRDIMTFRVASSKHRGQGQWDHPGTEATHLLDEAYTWARNTWEREIIPKLVLQITKSF